MNTHSRITILLLLIATSLSLLHGKETLDTYNIRWTEASKNASESMPIGGGDIGCNVWVENGDLLFYIQRSGCFTETSEYVKLGRVRLRLSPNPFANYKSFRQELILRDGFCELEARGKAEAAFGVKIRFWVDIANPVVHVDVVSDKATTATATYESWRFEDKELSDANRGRFGAFNLEGYPKKVIKRKDQVETMPNGIVFYHHNPTESYISTILLPQQGLEKYRGQFKDNIANRIFGGFMGGDGWKATQTVNSGVYLNTPYKGYSIESKQKQKSHSLAISTRITQTETPDQWKAALHKLHNAAQSNRSLNQRNSTDWWNHFWQRSYIFIQPEKADVQSPVWQASRNYQLFRYQLGCNAFGEYPSKFNGGSFTYDPMLVDRKATHDPDWRQWGGDVFTAQNQRLLYWPMLKAGDFDAIQPQMNLYSNALEGGKIRVKEYFGHGGAFFCEYMNLPGLHFGAGYGWDNTTPTRRKRGVEIPFGDPAATAVTTYEQTVERGVKANGAIAYHWESQVEHAYMMLEYHRFTGADISHYMPFIKESLLFFDEHYRVRQKMRNGRELDENGKLVFFPSTSCESYRGAKNPADLLSGIRACLTELITLDATYVSDTERAYYQSYLKRLPNLFYGVEKGDTIVKPAESYMKYQNVECPQFYPLFPFNQFDLESDRIPIFRNTWKHGTFPKNMVISWHQDGIFYARMGMTKDAARYNVEKLKDAPRRFPTFWGPGHDWVPDHNWGGSGMIGLQEMLMQTVGTKIILFPAWEKTWNVKFKLHAPNQTTVEGELKDGKVVALKVLPESRKKDVVIY